MIDLRAVTREYDFHDESGYKFNVTAVYDPETGWSAHLSMASFGHKECDDSVAHLRHAAEAFLRQLAEGVMP